MNTHTMVKLRAYIKEVEKLKLEITQLKSENENKKSKLRKIEDDVIKYKTENYQLRM